EGGPESIRDQVRVRVHRNSGAGTRRSVQVAARRNHHRRGRSITRPGRSRAGPGASPCGGSRDGREDRRVPGAGQEVHDAGDALDIEARRPDRQLLRAEPGPDARGPALHHQPLLPPPGAEQAARPRGRQRRGRAGGSAAGSRVEVLRRRKERGAPLQNGVSRLLRAHRDPHEAHGHSLLQDGDRDVDDVRPLRVQVERGSEWRRPTGVRVQAVRARRGGRVSTIFPRLLPVLARRPGARRPQVGHLQSPVARARGGGRPGRAVQPLHHHRRPPDGHPRSAEGAGVVLLRRQRRPGRAVEVRAALCEVRRGPRAEAQVHRGHGRPRRKQLHPEPERADGRLTPPERVLHAQLRAERRARRQRHEGGELRGDGHHRGRSRRGRRRGRRKRRKDSEDGL
ncbi:hypothetical protein AAVH_30126, partial [Aphelenchoides avenae]